MAAPSREEALQTLEEGHREVLRLLQGVHEDDMLREGTIGDGDWSAKDLVGHLAAWEDLAVEAVAAWREGRRPKVEEIFADAGGVDRHNAETVASKRGRPLEEVLRSAAETHARLVQDVESLTQEQWSSHAPYATARRRRLADLLGSILGAPKHPFGHAFAHLPDLEAYVRSLGS